MDIYAICLDEIALEGLDGATLSTLWLRLNQREEKVLIKITEDLKEVLWRFLCHCDVEFFHLASQRDDPIIFNRFLGIDLESGKHVAMAPDELEILQDVYVVRPVSQTNIKGSSCDFNTRVNVTKEIKDELPSLTAVSQRYGDGQLAIVASQEARERVLRGPGITPQTVQSLTEIEYCILERIGRSRWQGEIQTFLNNFVFNELKTAHIHYMMKSLFRRGLVCKQPYSYIREDKGGKVYQQILVHLPHFKRDCQSVADARVDMVCEILQQNESRSMPCSDLKQIINLESRMFRKLTAKMVTAGNVRIDGFGTLKNNKYTHKMMVLLKTPAEKQEEETLEEETDDSLDTSDEAMGLVAELPIALQGHRYIYSTGENGCSQAHLLHKLTGYGSLEARHICRKVEKAKIVKTIMVDHGRQRTQKYIAKSFAINSSHTKQFLAEKQKMKEIIETSDMSTTNDSLTEDRDATIPVNNDTLSHHSDNNLVEDTNDESIQAPPNGIETPSNGSQISDANHTTAAEEEEEEDHFGKRTKWESHQTTRKMKRTNVVLSFVNENKIVEGFFAFQKLLQMEEKDEGLTTKICKKTVKRLIQKLNNDGLVKHVAVPITVNECSVDVDFVMSLDCEPVRFKTAVEQAQFKKYSEDTKRMADQDIIDISQGDESSASLYSSISMSDIVKVEDLRPVNRLQYGFQPKFLRTQVVHEYLWYLAYGHPQKDNSNSSLSRLDYDKVKEYSKERSWKRYLPPAPFYPGHGPGWLQVGDAAVLLPLCILCQYHQYPYMIDGLENFMNDPTQRNTLVRHLPIKMKGLLLHKRKYLFSLIQVIETLCFMGLVTFNQQKKTNNVRARKETEMIYIHKTASIVDTRKSEKHYNEVTPGLDYERIHFKLDRFGDVEKYWMKLKDVCLMTALGVKVSDDVDNEPSRRHSVMLKTFISHHVVRDNPEPKDNGEIPGDRKGAGGLDSSLFSHLYRNWVRTMRGSKNAEVNGRKTSENHDSSIQRLNQAPRRLPKLVPLDMNLSENSAKKISKKSVTPPSPITVGPAVVPNENAEVRQKPRSKKRSMMSEGNGPVKKAKLSGLSVDTGAAEIIDVSDEKDDVTGKSKQSVASISPSDYDVITVDNAGRNELVKGGRGLKRKSQLSKPFKEKRKAVVVDKPPKHKYHDEVDLKAIQNRKGKYRTSFSSTEDEVLLMCKITSTLLSKKIRIKGRPDTQNAVPGSVIRSILHQSCEESNDKTSYSCLRRIRGIMSNKNAQICHDISVAELLEDKESLETIFKDVDNSEAVEDANLINRLYKKMLEKVREKFTNAPRAPDILMPDSLHELSDNYHIKVFTSSKSVRASRVVPKISCPGDVTLCVLENLMYATLSLNEDEFSAYQAYKIFENYSEDLISQVWNHVKNSGIICKKPDNHLSRQRHLPFAVPRFHLSKSHFQYLQSDSLWATLGELSSSFFSLMMNRSISCDMNTTSGPVVLMNMMLLSGCENFDVIGPNDRLSKAGTCKDHDLVPSFAAITDVPMSADDDIAGDVMLSDNEESGPSDNELYKLYRKRRFANCLQANNRSVFPISVVKIHLRSQPSVDAESPSRMVERFVSVVDGVAYQDDVGSNGATLLDSVKLRRSDVIFLDDDVDSDKKALAVVTQQHRELSPTLHRVVGAVREAGVIGVPFLKLRSDLIVSLSVDPAHIDETIQVLCDNEIIFSVGMYSPRAVLRMYADKWFVTGRIFKGERRLLRDVIRQELEGTTKRYDGKHLPSYKHPKKRLLTEAPKTNRQRFWDQSNSRDVMSPKRNNDDVIPPVTAPPGGAAHNSTTLLMDSSNYDQVKFLCRPWHNVSGETNYRTAKLLLSGVFTYILWHPGVALRSLAEHFIRIMQQIALLELLQKLITCRCITRCRSPAPASWDFFEPLVRNDTNHMTSHDDDYFTVTKNGLLRMSALCEELDKLQASHDMLPSNLQSQDGGLDPTCSRSSRT